MNSVLVLHSVTVKHDMNNTKGSFHMVFPIVVEKEKEKKKKFYGHKFIITFFTSC